MLAMLPNLGRVELVVISVALVFWIGFGAFVAFGARALIRKTSQTREIARLSEENQRLRDALADRRGGRV